MVRKHEENTHHRLSPIHEDNTLIAISVVRRDDEASFQEQRCQNIHPQEDQSTLEARHPQER